MNLKKKGLEYTMKKTIILGAALLALNAFAAMSEPQTLWRAGDNGIRSYRIPALCTAPNGDLVAACDARTNNGGDLNVHQPINITIRRSSDNGKTWTEPVNSWNWPWEAGSKWSGSDPSFIVDKKAKKIFLFYNVWDWTTTEGGNGVYLFYVQESADNGKTWSKPRDITKEIAFEDWPFFAKRGDSGFIFISSGSGIQTKSGALLHTLVHANGKRGNAIFGSLDHGKTWKSFGKPTNGGDECKIVELADGSWMINSRCGGCRRLIHISKDKGETWESHFDNNLMDPGCNAQIMRFGNNEKKILLYTGCKSSGRNNVTLRVSTDDGKTWTEGITICEGGSAYSDITILKDKSIGVLWEGAGYQVIDFAVVPAADIMAEIKKGMKK